MDYGSPLPTDCKAGFEATGGTNRYITPSTNYFDNQWHHAVVTFNNANNIVKLFVDGLQIEEHYLPPLTQIRQEPSH